MHQRLDTSNLVIFIDKERIGPVADCLVGAPEPFGEHWQQEFKVSISGMHLIHPGALATLFDTATHQDRARFTVMSAKWVNGPQQFMLLTGTVIVPKPPA